MVHLEGVPSRIHSTLNATNFNLYMKEVVVSDDSDSSEDYRTCEEALDTYVQELIDLEKDKKKRTLMGDVASGFIEGNLSLMRPREPSDFIASRTLW